MFLHGRRARLEFEVEDAHAAVLTRQHRFVRRRPIGVQHLRNLLGTLDGAHQLNLSQERQKFTFSDDVYLWMKSFSH